MADDPIVWEVLLISFVVFGMIAAITTLVIVYIAICRRHLPKSVRSQQHVVRTNGRGTGTIPILSQSKPFGQASDVNANANAHASNPRTPHHHRRNFVYYLDGDSSNPFIGLKDMFGRHTGSSSLSLDLDSSSLTISPSHPAIFGSGKDVEMSVKVKCMLTPPTPLRASGNPREQRASMVDFEDST